MAGLNVIDQGEIMMCVVPDVLMPDGTKRLYCDVGRNALAHIYERILLDKAFIREMVRAMTRRVSA